MIRKIRSLVFAFIATVVLGGGSAFAVTVATTTFTGLANFSGSGSISFSFTLKNVSNNQAVNNKTINWSTSTAWNTTKNDSWVRAEQYAVVAATVTKAGFNVYMYQTNLESTKYKPKNSSGTVLYRGNYEWNGSTFVWTSSSTSGLVRENIKNESAKDGNYRCYIPIAYSFVPSIQSNITYDQKTATTSATRADRYFCDIKDTKADGTPRSSTGRDSYTLIASVCGPVFDVDADNGPWCGGTVVNPVVNHTAYMYFFGNFKNIIGGDVYGTDQLHIVQVTE